MHFPRSILPPIDINQFAALVTNPDEYRYPIIQFRQRSEQEHTARVRFTPQDGAEGIEFDITITADWNGGRGRIYSITVWGGAEEKTYCLEVSGTPDPYEWANGAISKIVQQHYATI